MVSLLGDMQEQGVREPVSHNQSKENSHAEQKAIFF
jgi:hypothetical protein